MARKTDKKVTKKTTKQYAYLVDLTDIDSIEEIPVAIVKGKVKAGVPVTERDYEQFAVAVSILALDLAFDFVDKKFKKMGTSAIVSDKDMIDILKYIDKKVNKKPRWYKRFWNWVTRKK